jgi:hypothetical protein
VVEIKQQEMNNAIQIECMPADDFAGTLGHTVDYHHRPGCYQDSSSGLAYFYFTNQLPYTN